MLACWACGDGARPPAAAPAPARAQRPDLRVVALTDPSGYLEPCGCQSRPLGGIDKAATQIAGLRSEGVPTLFVAAGNLFFANEAEHEHGPELDGAAEQAALQARWQAETLAQTFRKLELAAAVPGPADARQGAELQRALATASGARLLGDASDADGVLLQVGGLQVGLFGVREQGSAAGDLLARAQRATERLRAGGAQIVIGLFAADVRQARRIAGGCKGLDVALLGGIDSTLAVPPERIGTASVLRAGRDGQGLLVVDLFRGGEGPYEDVSPWSRKVQQEARDRTIAELAERIAAWQRDANVDPKLLAEQRARLHRLREESAAAAAPARPEGNALSARFIELGPEVKGDPATRALLEVHDKRVNDHNRTALAHLKPKPVKQGMPGYLGSAKCGSCHESELAWWKGHAHGRAYATLEQRNKQFNLSCVGCHVTGYNQPGGATAVHNEGLTDVGCESCHGPGSLHAEDQDVEAAKNVVLDAPESVCKQCHNPEHSDRFVYDAYRALLIVPGHGQPAKAAQ